MTHEQQVRHVEVSFVGVPPVERVQRATGVSEILVEGSVLRCHISGSFQSFLEALRGSEVIGFHSIASEKEISQ